MLALIESEKRSGVCRTMPIWRRSEIEIHRADVHPVHEHRALRHIVEARDQVDQRGLAGAGLSDQGDDLVRLDGQVDAGQGKGFFVLDTGSETLRNSTRPLSVGSVTASAGDWISGSWSRISSTRCAPAAASPAPLTSQVSSWTGAENMSM